MKVIYIMADSLRRDHVSVYGGPPWSEIHTPNLARLASISAVFEQAYIGSFPTVPNRRDTLLGRGDKGIPFNRWKGLDADEVTFPRHLSQHGIPSMLITDTRNNVVGLNLFRDYTAWTVNRGQEGDACWMDETVPLEYPVPEHLIRYKAEMWHRVLINRARRRVETDWFAPGTYTLAMEWLERNYRRDSFFLWIDTFDPHEPWDPPQHYIDRYDPGYEGRVFEAPTYGQRRRMGITDRELQHIRARYAGEVTMVDAWFGRLLSRLEELGILDETAILFTADHGTQFDGPGDQGMLQKAWTVGEDGMFMSAGRPVQGTPQCFPLSVNIARIPLLIHLPGMTEGVRVPGIVQPWDVTATLMDLFGAPCPEQVTGRSVLPLISGTGQSHREVAVVGMANGVAQAMDERWLYAVWPGQRSGCLFDRESDPEWTENVLGAHPEVAARLHAAIVAFMREQGASEELIARYQA